VKPNLKTIQKCPVCGNSSLSLFLTTKDYFLTQSSFTIDQCNSCGFVFTNPIPFLSDLPKYYDSPEYLSHTANSFGFTSQIYKIFRNANIRNKFRIVNRYAKEKTILDIGCGTGELLHYFQKMGWKVQGVEPNESARKFAQKNYNIPVLNEDSLAEIDEESFDIISMWHVLEHVPDLNGRMIQLKKLVKKEGILIIALPNLNAPDAIKYGPHWAGLDVPRHLYHFTEDSFRLLLEKHQMELLESIPMKFDAYYVSLLSEKYLKKKLPYLPAFANGFKSNLQARKNNNYSSMIFVVKPNR
jgi:2-polyprenyl-3-methyl-5-hydroxy-6-metoxy-1,4-benzoquinol methylase